MSRKTKIIAAVIFVLHLVGALGTVLPETRELTISLTPFNLVLSTILLSTGHKGNKKSLVYFFLVSFTLGFLVELIGVQTGIPFGEYSYGEVLGWKVYNVPIIIGINWFMLSYAFGMLYDQFNLPALTKSILAAMSMTTLDLLIEQVALTLNYWSWEGGTIPIQNFIGWFLVALGIQFCFKIFIKGKTNPLVIPLIVSQIMYFTLVFIFVKF